MTGRGRVAVFKGQSQYDTVRCMTDDLADGFREIGYDVLLLDLADRPHDELAAELLAAHADGDLAFCHGFYGWGIGIGATHETFADRTGVPFAMHLIDPPYMIAHDRLTQCRNQLILVHDADALGYLHAFPGIHGSFGVVNPGAPSMHRALPDGTLRRAPVRDMPPIAAMTAHPMHELNAHLAKATPTARAFIGALVELAASDPYASVHGAAIELIRPFGWLGAPERFAAELDDVRRYLNFGYTYAHALRRARLAPQLLELPILLAGHGWNQFPGASSARATLVGALEFRSIEELMGRSPMLVNVMPPWADALHDRITYAAAGGAHVVTTTNRAIERDFGASITTFGLDGSDVTETVMTLLAHPERAAAAAAITADTLMAGHTWAHRAGEIAAAVARHRETRSADVVEVMEAGSARG